MAELLLFRQLVMTLKRHRYATDNPSATVGEALLDKLIARLAGSLNKSFVLEKVLRAEAVQRGALRQRPVPHADGDDGEPLPRQLRIYPRRYLLQHAG